MRDSPLDTAPIVRRIFDLSEAGNGMTDITRTLDKGGIASPRGRQWGKTSVHAILINEAYTGIFGLGNERQRQGYPGKGEKAFSAIITRKQFERVAKLMTSRAPKIANPRRVGSPFLLSGLVKCKTYRRDH